jgi:hypothetical protein
VQQREAQCHSSIEQLQENTRGAFKSTPRWDAADQVESLTQTLLPVLANPAAKQRTETARHWCKDVVKDVVAHRQVRPEALTLRSMRNVQAGDVLLAVGRGGIEGLWQMAAIVLVATVDALCLRAHHGDDRCASCTHFSQPWVAAIMMQLLHQVPELCSCWAIKGCNRGALHKETLVTSAAEL